MNILDKIGVSGTIVAGFGLSCCLPLFAAVGSAIGLGFLARYESQMNYLMQSAVVLAVAGTIWAYRTHRDILPAILAVFSGGLIFYAVNIDLNSTLIYPGLTGLTAAAVLNAIFTKRCGNCEIGGKA